MSQSFFMPGLNYENRHWFTPGSWQELFLAGSAYRLGIFDCLASGASSAAELADSLGADERSIALLLEALTGAGYLNKDGSRYSPTELTAKLLIDKHDPAFIGFSISHSMRLAERWLTLSEVVTTGEPVAGDRFTETVEGFVKAMDVYARDTADEVVEICFQRQPRARKALDIGGATGTVSRLFAGRGVEVTLFDLPSVVDLARKELSDIPNLFFFGGDFNEKLPEGPFDIVFLGNVTHIYGPDKNAALFKRVANALNPGGTIAILDFVRGMSPSAPFFGLNMLVNTGEGGTWTVEEYTDWLKAAGFDDIEFINVDKRDQQLVVGALDVENH